MKDEQLRALAKWLWGHGIVVRINYGCSQPFMRCRAEPMIALMNKYRKMAAELKALKEQQSG